MSWWKPSTSSPTSTWPDLNPILTPLGQLCLAGTTLRVRWRLCQVEQATVLNKVPHQLGTKPEHSSLTSCWVVTTDSPCISPLKLRNLDHSSFYTSCLSNLHHRHFQTYPKQVTLDEKSLSILKHNAPHRVCQSSCTRLSAGSQSKQPLLSRHTPFAPKRSTPGTP